VPRPKLELRQIALAEGEHHLCSAHNAICRSRDLHIDRVELEAG
jgi:hypothetical protein